MSFKSASRYAAFSVQTAKGTPAVTPTLFIPSVVSQTQWKWNANIQNEEYATGDLFMLVDGIPIKPMASGVLQVPFKPSVLNTLFAASCYANGDVLAPVWCTFFIGDGLNEKIYSDVLCTQAKMYVTDDGNPAMWTLNYLGLQVPVPHAVRAVTLPTYERSIRMPNLIPATVLGVAAVNGIEQLTLTIDAGTTAYYGSRGDGKDGPSDLIVNRLNVTLDVVQAYLTDAVRLAYVTTCGAPNVFTYEFDTSCGTAHTHAITLPNGLVVDDEEQAPDDLVINETYSVKGLRSAATSGAVATFAIT